MVSVMIDRLKNHNLTSIFKLTAVMLFAVSVGTSPTFASIGEKSVSQHKSKLKKSTSLNQKKLNAKKFMNESSVYKRLNSKKLKAVVFPEKIEMNEFKTEDFNKLVPRNLENSSSEAYVANRFGDTFLQNIFNSPQVRNSPLGQTATKVESAMKTEVSLNGPSAKSNSAAVGSTYVEPRTEHKISFQVLALQAQTKLEYKGWTNATLKHDARAKETGVEISEKIWHNKDLVLSHSKNDTENKSALGVRWNW